MIIGVVNAFGEIVEDKEGNKAGVGVDKNDVFVIDVDGNDKVVGDCKFVIGFLDREFNVDNGDEDNADDIVAGNGNGVGDNDGVGDDVNENEDTDATVFNDDDEYVDDDDSGIDFFDRFDDSVVDVFESKDVDGIIVDDNDVDCGNDVDILVDRVDDSVFVAIDGDDNDDDNDKDDDNVVECGVSDDVPIDDEPNVNDGGGDGDGLDKDANVIDLLIDVASFLLPSSIKCKLSRK